MLKIERQNFVQQKKNFRGGGRIEKEKEINSTCEEESVIEILKFLNDCDTYYVII